MNKSASISIVVPAYNEAKRLPQSIQKLQTYLKSLSLPYEVIVVVEKSTDQTFTLAKKASHHLPEFQIIDNLVHKGKGYAVKSGMLKAQNEIVIFMDADLSTQLDEIQNFLKYFEAHPDVDVLIGNRKHKETELIKKQTLLRRKMGQTFNLFVKALSLPDFKDTQCGFKAFRKKCVRPIFELQKLNHFAFDVELLILAKELGFVTHDLPVKWKNSPESKVNIVRDSIKMLWDLLKIRRLVRHSLLEKSQNSPPSSPAH